ncbi:MAG: hypothetical protein K2K31_02275, partial [Clostridia bacterium]|nr:hypothetical protein [Clostridia bacterium]
YEIKNPYTITDSSADNAVGGYVGYQVSGILTISGQSDIAGVLDIQAPKCNVGGMIGKTLGQTNITTSGVSTLDISVSQSSESQSFNGATFNVGGMIGDIAGSGNTVEIITNPSYNIRGNTISNVSNIKFGGAVGFVERTDWNDSRKSISITNIAYGGALKIYENIESSTVTVGGIVGEFSLGSNPTGLSSETSSYKISQCKTYGDVFVMYPKAIDEQSEEVYNNAKLKTYNFGGIVGSASYIVVTECSSLMTSFNSKYTEAGTANAGNYNVNALVGASSECVAYSANKYSSGVNLTYQLNANGETSGNEDCTYGGNKGTYNGYVGLRNTVGNVTNDILEDFRDFAVGDGNKGTKLNPYELKDGNPDEAKNKSHGISWYKVNDNFTINNSLFKELTNAVIVGNTNTIKFEEKTGETGYDATDKLTVNNDSVAKYGGLVNVMGNKFAYANDNKNADFTVISGLIMNLGIDGANFGRSDYSKVSFGGVAGEMYGNSIIYGVGVNGTLSVGGDKSINLGGLVGMVNNGLIQECYTDVDMIYRGKDDGFVSGLVNTNNYNSLIRTSYASGQIESYVNANIYTLAYSNPISVGENVFKCELMDVYSVTQVKRTDALSTGFMNSPKTINLINDKFSLYNQIVNGCNDVTEGYTGVSNTPFALSYDGIINKELKIGNNLVSGAKDNDGGLATWYFTPYTNYGFASHGFGYLKNTTTYRRITEKVSGGIEDTVNKDGTYAYEVVPYSSLVNKQGVLEAYNNDWYLSILNTNKFVQMINSKDVYKYLLKYDVNLTSGNAIGQVLNRNESFALDGNMKTLTFTSENSGLFKEFKGTIENLRIVNNAEKVSGANNELGLLANKLLGGKLKNITVIGNIENNNAKQVGGVVGFAENKTKFENIESIVNITNTASASIVGGIVGYSNGATFNVVSNSGIIKNDPKDTEIGNISVTISGQSEKEGNIGSEKPVSDAGIDSVDGEIVYFNSITGGLVGYMNEGQIKDSYNVNAVLANYTKEATQNTVAGGLVGYANNSEIISSYNTGMVGAGNYKNNGAENNETGYSFAGGIFGYSSLSDVTNCFNDAKVEALGTGATNRLYRQILSGEENINAYTNEPNALKYGFTIVYNQGLTRKVYAYGIGYNANGGMIENSGASTNNIINDGVIGQRYETKTMIFDRKTILDNSDDKLSYGMFNINQNVYQNGVDSYGFPTHIYMTDTITRAYLPLNIGLNYYDNELANAYNYVNPTVDSSWKYTQFLSFASYKYINGNEDETEAWYTNNERYDNNAHFYLRYSEENSKQSLSKEFINSKNLSYIKGEQDDKDPETKLQTVDKFGAKYFDLSCQSEYYSSVAFKGYDEILKDENSYITTDSDENVTQIEDNETKETVSDVNYITQHFINKIDEKRKVNVETFVNFNVAGETVAVVYNKNNIDDVYSPFRCDVEFTFSVTKQAGTLTKKSLVLKDSGSGKYTKSVIKDLVKTGEDSNNDIYLVTATLYFNSEVTAGIIGNYFTVQLNYEKTMDIELAKNMVVNIDNNTYILLNDIGLVTNDGQRLEINKSDIYALN